MAEMTMQEQANEQIYRQAVDDFSHYKTMEKMAELRDVFAKLGTYKQSETYRGKCELFLQYKPGNVVTFGNYKGKPLTWKVLAQSSNKFMLFAQKPVDYVPFHFERVEANWATCSMRRWLNSKFLEEAFTIQERMSILLFPHKNDVDPRWDDANGPETRDKLWVLNLPELDEYLPDIKDRAIGEWWWLRGHGCSNLNQHAVYFDGSVYIDGVSNHSDEVGVRPAMWVVLR